MKKTSTADAALPGLWSRQRAAAWALHSTALAAWPAGGLRHVQDCLPAAGAPTDVDVGWLSLQRTLPVRTQDKVADAPAANRTAATRS